MIHRMILIIIVSRSPHALKQQSNNFLFQFPAFSTMTKLLIIFHFSTLRGIFFIRDAKNISHSFASTSRVQCIFNLFLAARLFFTTIFL